MRICTWTFLTIMSQMASGSGKRRRWLDLIGGGWVVEGEGGICDGGMDRGWWTVCWGLDVRGWRELSLGYLTVG